MLTAREVIPRLARRAWERCGTLACLSETDNTLTRTFLCPAMHAVHDTLASWMQEVGMSTHVDAAGNLRGHYPSQSPGAPCLLLGSHLDTVPNAGKYDGVLGVLLALASVEVLAGRALPFAIDVIGFSEEEGIRFGAPYLGSLATIGELTPDLLVRRDSNGICVSDAIRAYGLNPNNIPSAKYESQFLLGYIETHIEQGPVLESLGLPLGVVEAIAGQTRARVTMIGQAGHAGTTPMPGRRDALTAAAEFVLAVETLAQATSGLVATVGQMDVQPGAGNVIPGTAIFSLDVRHAQDIVREESVARLRGTLADIAQNRRVNCDWQLTSEQAAVPMDTYLSQILVRSVAAAGFPVHTLVSGAGHDAAVMARMTPAAMLFLRSPGGLSHHPDEAVLPADVEAALLALVYTLQLLEEQHHAPRTFS